MKLLIITLILCLIIMALLIVYFISQNKLITIQSKIDAADEIIKSNLKKKHDLMIKLYNIIKKNIDIKDYFNEFSEIKKRNLTSYELDERLSEDYELMKKIKEDNKKIKTDLFDKIDDLDQIITAGKRYYNKNNNVLIKNLYGYNKYVAKISGINVKNSYDIKEPIGSNQ